MANQWYTKKWVAVSLHILFWALWFAFPYLLRPVSDNNGPVHAKAITNGFYNLNFANNLIRLVFFYVNAYLLIPLLVYKKRYWQYLLGLLTTLGVMLAWDSFFFHVFLRGLNYKVWNFFVFNLPIFIFLVITSAAFRMIRDRIEENQRAKEKENENLKTELSLLRSQVSPHFMFNIMNNMVALARKRSELLEPSLIKLSSLLRYMLYETEEKVPLQREVEYLQSYIDLQSQRFGEKVKIKVCMENVNDPHEIEPMLLIPFVENAFKHGTGMIENAEIDINLKTGNNTLYFSVRNKFNEASAETKDKSSGIGLMNVRRRLALLYRNQHILLITKQDDWFIVSLQIALH
jgi:two-component system, LytTR family, sensor kinase